MAAFVVNLRDNVTASEILQLYGRSAATIWETFFQRIDGIQTKRLIFFSRKHPTEIVAVNNTKSSVSRDEQGITIDARHASTLRLCAGAPAAQWRSLQAQLSHELNGLVAQHNPDLVRKFFRSLGHHPLQRCFSPTQLDLPPHHRGGEGQGTIDTTQGAGLTAGQPLPRELQCVRRE